MYLTALEDIVAEEIHPHGKCSMVDMGVGPYEFWGRTGWHSDIQPDYENNHPREFEAHYDVMNLEDAFADGEEFQFQLGTSADNAREEVTVCCSAEVGSWFAKPSEEHKGWTIVAQIKWAVDDVYV